MTQTAKVFLNGRSQAVRLPAEFRFDSDEVYIRKDPKTGDIILSRKPDNWDGLFTALKGVKVPDGFLSKEERELAQQTSERDPFEGWQE